MIIVVNTFYIHNFPLHCHCHYTVKPRTGSEIHVLYSGSHSIYKTITTNHTVAVCIYVGLNVGYIVNKQCVSRKIYIIMHMNWMWHDELLEMMQNKLAYHFSVC